MAKIAMHPYFERLTMAVIFLNAVSWPSGVLGCNCLESCTHFLVKPIEGAVASRQLAHLPLGRLDLTVGEDGAAKGLGGLCVRVRLGAK